jgi:hypothetical protein
VALAAVEEKINRNTSLSARIRRFNLKNLSSIKWSELLSEAGVLANNGLRAEVFKPSFPPYLSPFSFLKSPLIRFLAS